jgi:ornithine carbamoyltransferase
VIQTGLLPEKMADKQGKIHALLAVRHVIVTDEVLDSENSIVIEQANK